MHHMTKYVPAKTEEYPSDIHQLSRLCVLQKIIDQIW